jgi:hypothetical protein
MWGYTGRGGDARHLQTAELRNGRWKITLAGASLDSALEAEPTLLKGQGACWDIKGGKVVLMEKKRYP